MNHWLVKRNVSTPNGTSGQLYRLIQMSQDSYEPAEGLFCYTLELEQPKIPVGEWIFERYKSPHFGFDVFMTNSVPGHTFLEIHIGNTIKDITGCMIVGVSITPKLFLFNSKIVFEKFMVDNEDQDRISVTFT